MVYKSLYSRGKGRGKIDPLFRKLRGCQLVGWPASHFFGLVGATRLISYYLLLFDNTKIMQYILFSKQNSIFIQIIFVLNRFDFPPLPVENPTLCGGFCRYG